MARASFRLLFAVLAAAAVLPGCDIKVDDGKVSMGVSRGRASDEWVRSYTLPKAGRLEIINENGEVSVKGTQGSQVKVTAHREASAGSDAEAEARLKSVKMREDVSPDRVSIEALRGEGEGFNFGRGVGIRYEIEVPEGLSVSIKNQNGPLRFEGVNGRITAATTNGNVTGDAISGAVQGSSVNGSVSMNLDAITGDVQLTTVNGAVRVEVPTTVDAELEAATVNGGVSVDDRLTLADVTRDRGSFGPATSIKGRLNKGGPQVTLRTTNGGVRVSVRGSRGEDDERGPELRERRGRGGRGERGF